jgi:predicted RecB family endonuclease
LPAAEGNSPLQLSGEATVRSATGDCTTISVEELTAALSKEINELRSELVQVHNQRESELKANLLTYIESLPETELTKLTADVGEEIVLTIKMLVDALMEQLGVPSKDGEVVLQQSVAQVAQLCMWQLVVGYKLRELEAVEKGDAAV